MDQEPQEVTNVNEFSEDYPLGGSLEPYDIWRDIEMLENNRRKLFSGKIRHLPVNSQGRCLKCYESLLNKVHSV